MNDAEWCDYMLARLAAAIAKEAPAGIGTWDEAWIRVDRSSHELMAEIHRIDAGGGDKEKAKRLGVDVLNAWRHVGARFRAGGGIAA